MLKLKLSKFLILIFLDWNKEFHVHIDVRIHEIRAILAQLDERKIDHLIYFTN